MFDDALINYPIDRILQELGSKPGKSKGMWLSPLREETTASLHYDANKNLWYDHGAGIGGTNVQLVMMAKHCSYQEARKFIENLSPNGTYRKVPEKIERKNEIRKVQEIKSSFILDYLKARKIPEAIGCKYCKEVIMYSHTRNRNFTWLGFENNSGGYALSYPKGMKSTNKAGITTFNTDGKRSCVPGSKKVAVFEGFFDYMSWLTINKRSVPDCDVVVLNSVHLLERAKPYIKLHDEILCYLDNDPTGQQFAKELIQSCCDKNIRDMSYEYAGYKDFNDLLKDENKVKSLNLKL